MRAALRYAPLLILAMTSVGVAGCAPAEPTTAASPTAKVRTSPPPLTVPAVGQCYNLQTSGPPSSLHTALEYGKWSVALVADGFLPIKCSAFNTVEVSFLGTLPQTSKAGPAGPGTDQPTLRTALAACEPVVNDYLGGDWHGTPLELEIVTPGPRQWATGARWYACGTHIMEIPHIPSQSVRDGLRDDEPARLSCLKSLGSEAGIFGDMADCGQPHSAEYVGTFRAPDSPWPGDDALSRIGVDGCAVLLNRYLGLADSDSAGNRYLSVDYFAVPTSEAWGLGLRDFRCLAVPDPRDQTIVGSVRGLGKGKPSH